MNNGAFGENFPYSNFHDLNMDWIIKIAKDFLDQYTSIQEIITNGEESLTNLTESGLTQLEEKKDALEALLQAWYDTHSEDIANELANALADIASELTNAMNSFDTHADEKASATLLSIPDDYSTLDAMAKQLMYEIASNAVPYVSDIESNEFTLKPIWNYGFISDGTLYPSAYTNTNRYTPRLFKVKNGTTIKNNYTNTLRVYGYNSSGVYQSDSVQILTNTQYTFTQDKWVRLNLQLANADATQTFDPNSVIEITGLATADVIGITKIPAITGGYINKYGELITDYPGNIYTDFVECKPGDVFIFKCKSTNADLPLMVKYNSSQVFSRVIIPGNLTYRWFTVLINSEGYVRFSNIGLDNALLAYKIPHTKRTQIGYGERNILIPEPKEITGFLRQDNTPDPASLSTWHSYVLDLDCNPGDVFNYRGVNGYQAISAILFNNDDILAFYRRPSAMDLETATYTIPEGCNRILLQSTNTTSKPVLLGVSNQYSNKLQGKLWCAIGDSITAGDGNNGRSYVELIKEMTGIVPTKKAVGGSGYHNGAGGSNQFYNRMENDATAYDLYTIMGSINDGNTPIGTVTDNTTDTIGGCMNATIQAIYALNPNARIAIISPTTAGDMHFGSSGYWKDYVDFQKEFCEYNAIPYLDLTKCDNLRPWDSTFNDEYYYHNPNTQDPDHGDRTHPNEKGYKRFVNQILEFLNIVI